MKLPNFLYHYDSPINCLTFHVTAHSIDCLEHKFAKRMRPRDVNKNNLLGG